MENNIWKTIFNCIFLLYGLMGILEIGPFTTKAILTTFMVVYFGVYYGFLNLKEEE